MYNILIKESHISLHDWIIITFWNLTWRPPSWIFKTWFLSNNFWAIDFPSLYQIWRNNVVRRRNYGPKSKSKMAAVRHLGFSKIRLLDTGTAWAADFPSLYQIWRKNVDRRRNYGQKSKYKMVAVRHLGFVTSSYRTTHEAYSLGYIGLSNFMLIRCIVLKIYDDLNFLQIWLEMPIHAPEILVFGGLNP